MTLKQRILFLAEAATLAHVVRPTVLAAALDPSAYEVCVATGADFRLHVEAAGLPVRKLYCIGTRAYLSAVSAGRPVFPYETLRRYVEDDLRVIGDFQPDLIVGDFRLSLAVSARLAGRPYMALTNAYWSPSAPAAFDVPVHAATRLLGVGFTNAAFSLLRPLILAQHSLPMHRLRRRHGMPSLGFDLRRVFTESDLTLFADVPELVPTTAAAPPARHEYLGPIVWSPAVPVPEGLTDSADARPLVYVSLGSSGDASTLDTVVGAVVACGCRVALTAPGGRWPHSHGDSVIVREMLPGSELAAMARLVICNGGSPGVHQALQQGTPVLGIPVNLDQMLNMHFAVQSGAALLLRADQLSLSAVCRDVQRLLREDTFRQCAQAVRGWFAAYCAEDRFRAVVSRVLGQRSDINTAAGRPSN